MFQRKIEDFVCENCGTNVKGDGYTNHCPRCLWSKHVDNYPGDRKNSCGGLMECVDAFLKGDQWVIVQECTKCGHIFKIKANKDDDLKMINQLSQKKLLRNN